MVTALKDTLSREFAAYCAQPIGKGGSKITLIPANNDTTPHPANTISTNGKSVFRDDSSA